jgi:chemotaxis-related protein WspB
MKALLFHIGPDRYALPLALVVRLLPAMALKSLPLADSAVAGLMDLHGRAVPVIDLVQLAGRPPAPLCVDSRIIVVHYTLPDGSVRELGLLAEHVLGVIPVSVPDLQPSGVQAAPFLGKVASDAHGMLQLVDPNEMLSPALRAALFQECAA